MARTIRVYEVLYIGSRAGIAGDGSAIYRTRDRRQAEEFAAGKRCYSGPATVEAVDVPAHIAQRWGV